MTRIRVPANRLPLFLLVAVSGVGLDLWSKSWAFSSFGPRGGSDWMIDTVPVRFRWHTSLNEGALWGMGQGFSTGFALLSLVAVAGILYWLFVKLAAESLWLTIALAFVSSGAVGNCYDRLGLHGLTRDNGEPIKAVRDFFHFQFGGTVSNPVVDWAIFNVADICLVTGAVMMVIQSMLMPPGTEAAEPSAASDAASPKVPSPTNTTRLGSESGPNADSR